MVFPTPKHWDDWRKFYQSWKKIASERKLDIEQFRFPHIATLGLMYTGFCAGWVMLSHASSSVRSDRGSVRLFVA